MWVFYNQTHWYPALLLERSCHQRRYSDFTCENQWTTHRYLYQTSWWEKISRAKKWTQYHWFSECGLTCCTSDCLGVILWNKLNFKTSHAFFAKFVDFLINGSSCSYHGRFYEMIVWRQWLSLRNFMKFVDFLDQWIKFPPSILRLQWPMASRPSKAAP
jgi:hypothetical protein